MVAITLMFQMTFSVPGSESAMPVKYSSFPFCFKKPFSLIARICSATECWHIFLDAITFIKALLTASRYALQNMNIVYAWPKLYMCTVYGHMYGNFPARNTVYTYVCMVLANPNGMHTHTAVALCVVCLINAAMPCCAGPVQAVNAYSCPMQ